MCSSEMLIVCETQSHSHVVKEPKYHLVCVSLQAEEKFLACIAAQQEWRQIHHLCYWELMWAYSFELNWSEAYRYADLLCKESKWSQVTTLFSLFALL